MSRRTEDVLIGPVIGGPAQGGEHEVKPESPARADILFTLKLHRSRYGSKGVRTRPKQSRSKRGDLAEKVVWGCFKVLEQTRVDPVQLGTCPGVESWCRWESNQPYLEKIEDWFDKPRGERALRELLALTESAVQAAVWLENICPGPLPMYYCRDPGNLSTP